MTIKGEIVIDANCDAFEGAVVHVYLEDVSLLDASSQRLASVRLTGVNHRSGEESRIAFEMAGEASGAPASCAVRAHVARHGGEDVRKGDLVTTEHVGVDPQSPGKTVSVRVRQV